VTDISIKKLLRFCYFGKARSDRTGIVVVVLEYSIQNQFGTPLHAFIAFALRGPQDVVFFEPILEHNVGKLNLYF